LVHTLIDLSHDLDVSFRHYCAQYPGRAWT
jgi:hypothetical protein